MHEVKLLVGFFIANLLMNSSYAKPSRQLKVSFKLKKYELEFNEEKISVKDRLLDLSIDKKKCNENLFNETYLILLKNFQNTKFQEINENLKPGFDSMLVVYNKENALLSSSDHQYLFFSRLVEEMKDFKIKESVLCP